MITLVLEASTYAGSVALLDGSTVLGDRSVAMRGKEHEALMPAVAELLGECGRSAREIGRVVCGAGPGSFTSLRIAGAIAKGIALASGASLVPVSSLALLVAARRPLVAGRYLATADAMRGERYAQEFEVAADGAISAVGGLSLIPSAAAGPMAGARGAVALGPAGPDVELAAPHARGAAFLTNMINSAEPADLAAWEPRYGRLAEAQVKWEAEHGRPLQPG